MPASLSDGVTPEAAGGSAVAAMAPCLSSLDPSSLQRVASFLPLDALASLVCSSARVRASIGSVPSSSTAPIPFPALAQAPSHAWPALARSPALRLHVAALVLPRSPSSGNGGGDGDGAHVDALDESDRALLLAHFPALTELRSSYPHASGTRGEATLPAPLRASVSVSVRSPVDLHFSANMRELDRMEPMRPLEAPPPPPPLAPPRQQPPPPPAPARETAAGASDAVTAAAAPAPRLHVNPDSSSDHFSPRRVSTPTALALLAAAAAAAPITRDHPAAARTPTAPGGTAAAAAGAATAPSASAPAPAGASSADQAEDAQAESHGAVGVEEKEEDLNESEPGSMVLHHGDSDEEMSLARGRESASESRGDGDGEHENEDEDEHDGAAGEEEEDENSVIMNADRPDLDLAPDTPPRSTHTDSDGEGEEGGRYPGGRGPHRPPSSSLSPPPAVGALSRPGSARRSRAPIHGERPRVSFAGVDSGSRASSVSMSGGDAAVPAPAPSGSGLGAAQPVPARSPRSANGMNRAVDSRQGSFSALALPSAAAAAAAGAGSASPSLSSSSLSPSDEGSGRGGRGSFSLRSQTRADLLASFSARGGPLTIVLLGARNLRLQPAAGAAGGGPGAPDDSAAPRGLPDPYVSLTATWAPRKKYKSSIQRQSSHPMFNQKFTLQVPPPPAGAWAAAVQAAAAAAQQQQPQQQSAPIHSANGPASVASVSGMDDSTMSFSLSTRDSTLFSAALRNAAAAAAVGGGAAGGGAGGGGVTGSAPPSSSPTSAAALCAGSSWGRAVRFRVYHKQTLGKRLLGEVVLDLQALLSLAAMQRDVWVPLRGKGESHIGADDVAAAVTVGGKEAPAVPQPQRLALQRRSVSQPVDAPSAPSLLSAAPRVPPVDRGELHLIVTVDPLSFAAMLQGLAAGGHNRMPQDSPSVVSRSAAAGAPIRAQEGERESLSAMQLPASAASASAAAAAAEAITRHLHGGATAEPAQRTLLRRRSRSDAGLTASSASAAAAAAEADEAASGGRSGSDDKAALGPVSLSGGGRRVGPSAAEQARHPSPSGSPHLTPSSSSRRAISMDLSSPADLLSRRRSLLAPVLAGDTPEHSATSTPRGLGLAAASAAAGAGLNSSESSLMMLHQSMDSVFSTPQKKNRGEEGSGGGSGGGAGSVAGGVSPGLSAIRPLGSAGSAGGGSASKLLLSAGGAASPAEHPSRSPTRSPAHYRSSSLQSMTPRGSPLEGVDEGAGAEQEQQQQQQQQLVPPPDSQRRALSSTPSTSASHSPLVLPAPSLSVDSARPPVSASGPKSSPSTRAAALAQAGAPSSRGYSSDGGDDGDADTSEDDFDDTILWSPEEQRRRETHFREKIARLRRTLRDTTQEAALTRRQMERREAQHAAAIKEAHAATIAAQTALAAAKSAPQAAPVSTRLEALLRDADRKLAAQSAELRSVQTALANARTLHARELEVLRSKLMQSAAESAAFAAYKKSSVMYVSSLRGANEAQLAQLQSLGSRLDQAESALRSATERHAASKARRRLRATALAEHLEQSNASLHALQGRHQNVVEQARQLQAELAASEATVAQLSQTLREERDQHAQLRSDLSSFSTRSTLRVGLELVAVLREVALAREELERVRRRRAQEEERIAAMQTQQREVDSFRAAHATLLQREASQRAALDSLAREHATLLDLLQAEVESKGTGAGTDTGSGAPCLHTAETPAAGASLGPQGCASASATMLPFAHAAPPRFVDHDPAAWSSPDGPQREGAAASAVPVVAHAAPAPPSSTPMALHSDAAAADGPSAHEPAASAALSPSASWSQLALSLAAARQQANGSSVPSLFLTLPLGTTNGPVHAS